MVIGFFLVVPVPPAATRVAPGRHSDESNWDRIGSSSAPSGYLPIPDASDVESSSEAELEDDDEERGEHPSGRRPSDARVRTNRDGTVLELSPARSRQSDEPDEGLLTKVLSRVSVVPSVAGDPGAGGVTGRRLLQEGDFWLLAAITSLLSGTGLMCQSSPSCTQPSLPGGQDH